MKKALGCLVVLGVVLGQGAIAKAIPAGISPEREKEIKAKLSVLLIPFIENKGQVGNSSVKYYANTLIGTVTVFVTNDELTYSLSDGTKTCVIKEAIAGIPIGITQSETRVNYFKDNNKEVRKCRQ